MGRVGYNDKSIISTVLYRVDASHVPKIGIAVEGGCYAAMFAGAGMLAAMDDRTVGAEGHDLGGTLQSSNSITGLSGGSWIAETLVLNNWTSVQGTY